MLTSTLTTATRRRIVVHQVILLPVRRSFPLQPSLHITLYFAATDKERFPSGMNNVTDQIHALGL
jgi:hypothetical protein